MKPRNTLILVAVFAALFAYVFFFESKRKSTRETVEAAGRVTQIDRDKINAVSIKNPDGKIQLRKGSDNQWVLEEPVKDRADSMAISQLFTSLETLRHDAKIEPDNKEQLKDYGVTDTNTRIRVTGEGQKPVELLVGKDAAVEGKLYVRVDGSDTVYVVGSGLKTQLNKKVDDFRDHKLADITTQQINRVVVKTKEGEIELEKKNNHWSITKPLKARGEDSKINDLLASATASRIDQFLADSSNLAPYGLTEPRGSVDIYTEGAEKPVTLLIGNNGKEDKDKEKTYAKLSTRDSVVLVPKEIEKILDSRPNDLRDKNLVRVESDIVDRLTIEAANKPKIVLARKGESWVRKDGDKDIEVNDAIPAKLLSDLKNTQVINFVADTATDLAKYGLDQPQLKVTLSSYASENTAETKAGDKPIVSVLFGKIEGDSGYAKLDEEPFIVAAPRGLIDEMPVDPIQLQPLAIYNSKADDISNLEMIREGQPPVSLEKDKDGKWKLAKGDGNVNQANVKAVADTLSRLHAIQWVGATAPEHGLEKPAVVASFTATQGDKKTTGKLAIGAATPDSLFYATADGFTGTFILSKPDRDVFDAPVIDKPAPAQPATPPPAAPASVPEPTLAPPAPASSAPAQVPTPAAPTNAAPAPAPTPSPAAEVTTPPIQAPATPAAPVAAPTTSTPAAQAPAPQTPPAAQPSPAPAPAAELAAAPAPTAQPPTAPATPPQASPAPAAAGEPPAPQPPAVPAPATPAGESSTGAPAPSGIGQPATDASSGSAPATPAQPPAPASP